jgi:spore coat protein CotF
LLFKNKKTLILYREIFLEAEKHIIELMKKNSYPRFLQSEQYRNLLQNASNPIPKKT